MQARMVEQLAEAVVRKARENKIIKGNKYVYRKVYLAALTVVVCSKRVRWVMSKIVVDLFPCSQGQYGHYESGRNWMSFPPKPYVLDNLGRKEWSDF